MTEADRFIVEIRTADGGTAGTGFVVSDSGHIATAHHVVCDSLGLPRNAQLPDDKRVPLYFHQSRAAVEAKILTQYQNPQIDVVILKVEASPDGVVPALLGTSTHTSNHPFNSKGYRPLPPYTGPLAAGEILGQIDTPQAPAGVKTLQLRSRETDLGMSGAPVVDATTGMVVGMIVEIWNPEVGVSGESRDALTAFAISAEGIKFVYPELLLSQAPEVPGVEGGYDRSLRDYLKAVRAYCAAPSYLTLDELIGSKNEIYIPLHVSAATAPESTGGSQLFSIPEILREATRNQVSQILIVGEPGAGKSTLLRHIARHSWEAPERVGLSRPHLPLMVALHEVARAREASIEELLWNSIKGSGLLLDTRPPDDFLTQWPLRTNSHWFFLLDGLDQVSAEERGRFNRKLQAVLDFADDGQHPVLVTSRPSGLDSSSQTQSVVYQLEPFSADEQTEFAKAYFGDRAAEFTRGVEPLGGSLLLGTPLLLTIAAGVFSKDHALPKQRAGLYRRFIEISLAEAKERGLENEIGERMTKFTSRGLERLALQMLEHATQTETESLVPTVSQYLQQSLNLSPDEAEIDAEKFLNALGRQSGILVSRDRHFEWVHRTFAEYLAASAFARQYRSDEESAQQWIDRWHDENWREVVLFLLGIWSEARRDVTQHINQIWKSGTQGLLFVTAALADGVLVSQDVSDGIQNMLRAYVKKEGFLEFLSQNRSRLSALDAGPGRDGGAVALLAMVWDRETNEDIRKAAIRTLGELDRAENLLSIGVNEAFPGNLRVVSAQELGELGEKEKALSILLPLAQDSTAETGVRWEAADALAKLERLDEAAAAFVDLIREVDSGLEARALIARLGMYRRSEELWALARDNYLSEGVRTAAIESLHGLGQPEPLLAVAQDRAFGWQIRIAAAVGAGELGSNAEAAEVLASLARDQELGELADRAHEEYLKLVQPEFVEASKKMHATFGLKGKPFRSGMRLAAVDALFRIRNSTSLLDLARDETVGRRVQAAAAKCLSRIESSPEALSIVLRLLGDHEEEDQISETRSDLADALGNIPGDESISQLISMAKRDEEPPAARRKAVEALGKFNRVDELLAFVKDEALDPEVRFESAESLGRLGLADGLLVIASDVNVWAWRRIEAAQSLQKLGKDREAASILEALCQDQSLSEDERKEAEQELAKHRQSEEKAPILSSLARNPDAEPEIRWRAVWDLRSLGQTDELLALMNDSAVDPDIRSNAMWALDVLGLTDTILATARSPEADSEVRLTAIGILKKKKHRLRDALSLLLPFIRDKNVNVEEREAAVSFLGEMKLVDELLALSRETDLDDVVSNAAVRVLGSLRQTDDLLDLMRQRDARLSVRCVAAFALGPLGAVNELMAQARDPETPLLLRIAAAMAGGEAGQVDEAVSILEPIAHDLQMDPNMRKDAARALVKLGRDEGATVLLSLAADSNLGVNIRASAALQLKELDRYDDAAAGLLALARDAELESNLRLSAVVMLSEMERTRELKALLQVSTIDTDLRVTAAKMLGEIAGTEDLLTILKDEAADVNERVAVARALGLLGEADELLAVARAEETNSEVRVAAANAVAKLDRGEEVAPILIALGQDQNGDGFSCLVAALVLRDIGHYDEAANILLTLARDAKKNISLRRTAVEALGKAERADELMLLAEDRTLDGWIIASTAEALSALNRDAEAISLFLSLANDSKQGLELRVAVIDALTSTTDAQVSTCFEKLANENPHEEIRKAAAARLTTIRQTLAQSGEPIGRVDRESVP
jgi:uncharacterized protein (UPF0147 family)